MSINPKQFFVWDTANALNTLPEYYDRKVKTQRNWRKVDQAVEHVVQFDITHETLPFVAYKAYINKFCSLIQGCMAVVSPCRKALSLTTLTGVIFVCLLKNFKKVKLLNEISHQLCDEMEMKSSCMA